MPLNLYYYLFEIILSSAKTICIHQMSTKRRTSKSTICCRESLFIIAFSCKIVVDCFVYEIVFHFSRMSELFLASIGRDIYRSFESTKH